MNMRKCEVVKDCFMGVCKGSTVYVTERQYELSRMNLKPVEDKPKKKKKEEVEETEE